MLSVAQVGVEPTASLVLGQGGLPVAYRAIFCLQYPEQESNLQALGFKPSRSAYWRIWASSSPGGTRTPDPLLVRELPSPLGHRTMLFQWTYRELHPNLPRARPVSSCWTISPSFRSGSRETRTHKRLLPPPVFKTGSSSGRMTSKVAVVGIEPTSRRFRAASP